MGTQKHIPVIKFHKDKYGDELLIDVVTLDMIRASKNFANALRQSFYGVMLTTGGEGDVEVDGIPCTATTGNPNYFICFCRWRWPQRMRV